MKQVSTDLSQYMNTEKHFEICDLYRIVLLDGRTYYISDYDVDVNYNGHIWEHNKGLFKRDQLKLTGEPTVDSLTVTIVCDRGDIIADMPMMKAAHDGIFSGCELTLYKVYFSNGAPVGSVQLFDGFCEVSEAGGIRIKLVCKSYVQGLSQNIPIRIFAPQVAYANKNGTVTTSSTDTTTMLVPLKPSQRVLVKI